MINSICLDRMIYSQSEQQAATQIQTNTQNIKATSSSTLGWENQGSNIRLNVINAKPKTIQATQTITNTEPRV